MLFKSESFITLIFLSFCFVFFLIFSKIIMNDWNTLIRNILIQKLEFHLRKAKNRIHHIFEGGKLSAPHIIDLLTPRLLYRVFFSARKRNYTHFHQFIWMSMLFISEKTQIIIIIVRCGSAAMPLLLLIIYPLSIQLLICIPKNMVRKTNSLNVMMIAKWSTAFTDLMTNAGGWTSDRGNGASYLFR